MKTRSKKLWDACKIWVQTPAFEEDFNTCFSDSKRVYILALILAFTTFGIPLAMVLILRKRAKSKKRRAWMKRLRDIAAFTPPTVAFIVIANSHLRTKPGAKTPALAISYLGKDVEDGEYIDTETMIDLTEKLAELYALGPQSEEDKEIVKAIDLNDDTYQEGRRRVLPASLTGGKDIYAVDLMIINDWMPSGSADVPLILCLAEAGDHGDIMMLPLSVSNQAFYEEKPLHEAIVSNN